MTKNITIDIEDISVNEQAADVKLRINVHPGTSPDQFNEVSICGTRAGLMFLAKQIASVAYAIEESHTHLDNECHAPIYESQDNWWLTIERVDKM